jgi:hypothetical protein
MGSSPFSEQRGSKRIPDIVNLEELKWSERPDTPETFTAIPRGSGHQDGGCRGCRKEAAALIDRTRWMGHSDDLQSR